MYTYLIFTLPFIALALLLDMVILRTKVVTKRDFWIVFAIMLGFTAVFDQFFTGLPIVHYDESLISGLRLWHAPLEDFSYTIAAVIGIGAVLTHVQNKSKH